MIFRLCKRLFSSFQIEAMPRKRAYASSTPTRKKQKIENLPCDLRIHNPYEGHVSPTCVYTSAWQGNIKNILYSSTPLDVNTKEYPFKNLYPLDPWMDEYPLRFQFHCRVHYNQSR